MKSMDPYLNIFVQLPLCWVDNWHVYRSHKILIMLILKLSTNRSYIFSNFMILQGSECNVNKMVEFKKFFYLKK